ncbi:MAG TPA: monovalent cation/H(+) antiporter subunit G [Pseudonocardiaceae bacterium]
MIVDVLVGVGTLVAVLAAVGALRARSVFRRLHCLTVVTSAAGPLVGAGAVVADGVGFAGGTVLAIVLLLAVTGPILGAAMGRLNAQRDGITEMETPA